MGSARSEQRGRGTNENEMESDTVTVGRAYILM